MEEYYQEKKPLTSSGHSFFAKQSNLTNLNPTQLQQVLINKNVSLKEGEIKLHNKDNVDVHEEIEE